MAVRTPVAHARLAAGPSTLHTSTEWQGHGKLFTWRASRQVLVQYPDKLGRLHNKPMDWAACMIAASQESLAAKTRGQGDFEANRRRTGESSLGVSDGE